MKLAAARSGLQLARAGLQPAHKSVFFIWAGWLAVLLGYQALVPARLDLARPDRALFWTAPETMRGSQADKYFLNEPFMNAHVAWDSEFYLAIAVDAYESDQVRHAAVFFDEGSTGGFWPFYVPPNVGRAGGLSLSYAFLPFYPLTMRAVSAPLSIFGMNAVATATLAGVVVSALGALAAMLALYELAKDELGEEGGIRAAFYLVIFPSGFFLVQVYTEGLFVGLAFWALLLMRRGRLGWAAALAIAATFTRAVGVALAIPLFLAWLRTQEWRELDLEWRQLYFRGVPWRTIAQAMVALSPLIAYQLWRVSYFGLAFSKVEDAFFSRGLLALGESFVNWLASFQSLFGANSQAAAYNAVEWGAILLGFAACLIGFRRHPDLAVFGFLVVFLSFTSGVAQGMHRYILAAPPVFLALARWGRNRAFDTAWTVASVLLMGLFATLFTFDLWAG
ncbi:MAG: hypothetical protein WD751_03660 [Anaerolineales bacterium]